MVIEQVMTLAPVIAVVTIDDVARARPLAEALVAGGLRAIEVTLRTPSALDVIAEMRHVEGAVVGAGTVLNESQMDQALKSGARFIVSPGLTEELGCAAYARGAPFLPGVATAGDVMRGFDMGFSSFKFFPAEANGGIAWLRTIAGPFRDIRFCASGGITPDNAADYLSLPSVSCVGGTWLAQPDESDWSAVTDRARAAAAIPNHSR